MIYMQGQKGAHPDKGTLQANAPTLYTGKGHHTEKRVQSTRCPYIKWPLQTMVPYRQGGPTETNTDIFKQFLN